MQTIVRILVFVLILGVVIFIHELGHFIAARRAKIFVEEFALGMGPILISKMGKKPSLDGQFTKYSLRAFPIGGFCKMRGENEEEDAEQAGRVLYDAEAFHKKSIPARALVMAGGSVMNFLLAFILFFTIIMVLGTQVAAPGVSVRNVSQGSPAQTAGLLPNDFITHINNSPVEFSEDIVQSIRESGGREIEMRILRDGLPMNFSLTPAVNDGRLIIGITMQQNFERANVNPFRAVAFTGELMYMQIGAPFMIISNLIQGDGMPEGAEVMGVVGMGDAVVEHLQESETFGEMVLMSLNFIAAISVALGVMNLLPIPALDGSKLIFLLIEAVRKKPIPPEKEAVVHMVGLALLLVLFVVVTYQDIARLIARVAGSDYPG